MKQLRLSAITSVAVLALVTACSSQPSRNDRVVAVDSPMATMSTQYGRVADIQSVSRPSGAGAVLGAVIGAAIGSQIGSGTGQKAAIGAGAVGGAVAGHQIEKRRADDVYRVSVRFDDGAMRNFDFERIEDLRVGDRVKWEGGQLYRM